MHLILWSGSVYPSFNLHYALNPSYTSVQPHLEKLQCYPIHFQINILLHLLIPPLVRQITTVLAVFITCSSYLLSCFLLPLFHKLNKFLWTSLRSLTLSYSTTTATPTGFCTDSTPIYQSAYSFLFLFFFVFVCLFHFSNFCKSRKRQGQRETHAKTGEA